jgi:hypothetical protein
LRKTAIWLLKNIVLDIRKDRFTSWNTVISLTIETTVVHFTETDGDHSIHDLPFTLLDQMFPTTSTVVLKEGFSAPKYITI